MYYCIAYHVLTVCGIKAGKMSKSFVALAMLTVRIDDNRLANPLYKFLIYQEPVTNVCQVIIQHAVH
jgi:hypothetical protein